MITQRNLPLCKTQVSEPIIVPPAALMADIKDRYKGPDMQQLAPDVWATWLPISPHIDSTAEGLVTYGLVLANDANYELIHDAKGYMFRAGTLYRIDGRIEHEARRRYANGLFAALIWDMPPVWSLYDFACELLKDPRFKMHHKPDLRTQPLVTLAEHNARQQARGYVRGESCGRPECPGRDTCLHERCYT